MKKFTLFFAFLAISTSYVLAQPSHEKYVDYAAEGVEWSTAYRALDISQIGTKPLYQGLHATAAENDQFFISRVKPRERFTFAKTQIDETKVPDRKFLWWCPIGTEGWNALPTYWFGGEVWTMWSYTDIFGNWTAPFVRMPAAMMDVCHKNGVLTSTLASVPWASYVSKTDVPHGTNFSALIDGGHEKFLRYLRYYGIDGIGFNSEFTFSPTSFSTEMKNFLSNCFRYKDEKGWPNFHNCWYSLMTNGGQCGGSLALTSDNKDWFHYNGYPTSNAYFMNYGFSTSSLNTSKNTANSCGRSSYDVYAGIDYQGSSSAYWGDLGPSQISLGIWGAHNMNMIYESRGELGANPLQMQKTYQLISENVFSGANYNPANTPALNNRHWHTSTSTDFWGFSTFITARSSMTPQYGDGTLAGDPFVTYFNLGNGMFFKEEGETTFNKEWYNLGIQDYMPTWRWWWTKTFMGKTASSVSKDMTAEFTWDDAWFGGSCLQITGATTTSYLQLFKTKYEILGSDKFTIRYKVVSGTGTIRLTASTEDNPTTEVSAVIVSNAVADEDTWVSKSINVSGRTFNLGNETLALLGLKFENTSSDFKVLIGEISITRGTSATPGMPSVEDSKIMAVTHKGVDAKIFFDMSSYYSVANAWDPIYNSDVKTSLYKIYTQQEGSDAVLCTATTSWAAYVVGAPYDVQKGGKFRMGVAAVSMDGKSQSSIAWGSWMTVPAATVLEGFSIDKPIIKAGEKFTVAFDDPTHPAATWVIKASENDAIKGTFNTNSFTTSLNEEGLYDLYLTMNGNTEVYRGRIQISPLSVGALPEIKTFTMSTEKGLVHDEDDTEHEAGQQYAEIGEEVTFSYTGRPDADGYVSRGFALGEKAFGIPCDDLGFNAQTPFSVTFWVYFNSINHEKSGTQLLNVRSPGDAYPNGEWGYIWSQLTPEGQKDDQSNSYHLNNLMFHYRLSSNAGEALQVSRDFVFKPQTWYHVAMCMGYTNNRTLDLYVNGNLVGSATASMSLYDWRSSNVIMIGGRASERAGIDGTIDEVRLYKKTLTASEVKESMEHQSSTVTDANFIGYWDFESEAQADNSMASKGYNTSLKAYKYNPAEKENVQYAVENVSYAAGAPFISGTNYKIETLPTWKIKGASLLSSTGDKASGNAQAMYSKEGTYPATLTLSNGWGSDTKTIEVVEIMPTGVEDVTVEDMMKAFPNPFENEVYLSFVEDGVYTVEIYDNAGRMLDQASLSATAGEIYPVAVDGESGIYFIKVKGDAGLLKVMKVAKK